MRAIKFRGKCAKDSKYAGEWVEGGLLQCEKSKDVLIVYSITDTCSCTYHVDPNTVGQFTGLHDRNGKAIYEGDILGCDRPNIRHLVFYCEKEARFKAALNGETKMSILGICGLDDRSWIATKEVIGNIHDNPELLREKGGEQ